MCSSDLSFDGSTPGNLMFETSGSFSTSGWVSVQVDSILVEPGQEFFVAYMLEDKSYAISFDRVTAPVNRSFFSGDGVTYSGTLGESYNINLRAKISNQNGTQDIYEPDISVSPDSLSEELYVGDSSTQVLTISNNGDADLDWEISFSAQQRVLGDFILPPGFIGNLDLSDNSTTSTATIILKDRPLSTHNNSSLNRDTMYDVLVYNSSAGVSTVINEHPEINATQVYSYVPEDLQDYQVLFNIRQDDIYSEETLEWIYNGGTWVGEWHSNDYPITS